MSQQEFFSHGLRRAEQQARHTFGDDGHRLTGIERGLIERLTVGEGEVEHRPELAVRLAHIDRRSGLAGQADRLGQRIDHIDGDGLGRRQLAVDFFQRSCTPRTVAVAVAPRFVGDAAPLHVQKAVAVAFGRKRLDLHLLHHHHQHDEEDGKGRTRHRHPADERLLAELRPGLLEILLDHLFNEEL